MRYATIVADPPWPQEQGYGKRKGWYYEGGVEREKPLPYVPMTLSEIEALPVKALAERECRLFLWTTNRHLHDAFHVLEKWGFRYTQTLVWHKPNASPFSGSVAFGSAEFLLVGVVGGLRVLNKATSSVLKLGHHHDHSRKPEAFLDLVESVSPGPYLELFARRQRLGWDTWGNEALEHVAVNSGV